VAGVWGFNQPASTFGVRIKRRAEALLGIALGIGKILAGGGAQMK